MSYGNDTWYMGRIYEELKNLVCRAITQIVHTRLYPLGHGDVLAKSMTYLPRAYCC